MSMTTIFRRGISPTTFALIAIAFALPFATVSCGNDTTTFTGVQLVTKSAPPSGDADIDEGIRDRAPLGLAVLLAAIAGLLLGVAGVAWYPARPGVCAAVGLFGTLALRVEPVGADITLRSGYIVVLSGFLALAILHFALTIVGRMSPDYFHPLPIPAEEGRPKRVAKILGPIAGVLAVFLAIVFGSPFRASDGAGVGQSPYAPPDVQLGAPQVHSLAVDPRWPDTAYAGTSDGVARSTDRGQSWVRAGLDGELIGDIDIDPSAPGRVYATSSTGGVFRSTDGGATWALTVACETCDLGELYLIESLAVDPRRPQTLYAGMHDGLAKSTDGGDSWVASDRGMPDDPGIQAIAVDPHDPEVVYAGAEGGLWRSRDGGTSWSYIGRKVGVDSFVDSIVVDPVHANTLYVTAGGPFQLLKSTDGGESWRRIRIRGDKGGSADAIAIDPDDPSIVYVGVGDAVDGDLGLLFASSDGGSTWRRIRVTGREPVLTLAVAPGRHAVYAGTRTGVRVLGRKTR